MRQAFVHAFLASAEREVLMKNADRIIFAQLASPGTERWHLGIMQTAKH